jgi:argininosuccinate synthase
MAANRIWLRGGDLYRRSGPGRGTGTGAQKAILLGIKPENIHIVDVREEFVRDFVFPMFRANALYEGLYLLGTSIARPLISQASGADRA